MYLDWNRENSGILVTSIDSCGWSSKVRISDSFLQLETNEA